RRRSQEVAARLTASEFSQTVLGSASARRPPLASSCSWPSLARRKCTHAPITTRASVRRQRRSVRDGTSNRRRAVPAGFVVQGGPFFRSAQPAADLERGFGRRCLPLRHHLRTLRARFHPGKGKRA